MVCAVRMVLGVEPHDRLDRFFDMDRKDRQRGVRFRHLPSSARDAARLAQRVADAQRRQRRISAS